MNHRLLNLGAGTQSSMLLIMCDRGDLPPVDLAIFADTKAEPQEVYRHLTWLRKQVKTRIVRVTAGDLESDAVEIRQHRFNQNSSTGRKGYASVPLFVLNGDGSQGMIRRQCTSEYKIEPITQFIRRKILKLKKGQVYRGDDTVTQIFGISFDERQRARNSNSDPRWMRREYPLIDLRLTRQMVIERATKLFPDHIFPRSACVFCPYKTNEEWRRLRDFHPKDFARAVAFDRAQRKAHCISLSLGTRLAGLPFVHRQLVPLDEADLRSNDEKNGQLSLFGMLNECEGMCGT